MIYANGPEYEGNFVHDIRHGKGKIVFAKGGYSEESYEGDWVDDQWHGYGIYKYRKDEGTVFEGQWCRGVRQGKGKITYRDGSFYRGDFNKDQMWGKGIYVGSDGTQYDGEWRANMRQGMGTSLETDGCIYHGQFWGNMKHGKGMLTRPDGSTYSGNWEGNTILGTGRETIVVGDKSKRDGMKKEITLKVFGY
eukprot:gene30018-39205_t